MERLARWCYRHRRMVVAIWVVVVVTAVVAANRFGGDAENDTSIPGTDSQYAVDLLRERFPEAAGDVSNLVVRADDVRDPAVRDNVERALDEIATVEHVVRVRNPYEVGTISADGTVAYAVIQFDVPGSTVLADAADRINEVMDELRATGLEVEIGGQALRYADTGGVSRPEIIGFLAATIVLLFTFASVVAAGLPIITAVFALGLGLSLLAVAMRWFSIADYAPQVASMLGLGVGIDYALLIVTRYRQGLHGGLAPGDAIAVAITTSGRSVIFAGTTVIISMSGLLVMGLPLLYGLAAGGMTAVFLTMIAAVTLLPAILGFAGYAIDRLPVGRRRRESGHRETAWFRWSRTVQRRPWWSFAAGATILLVIAAPVFSMRLGSESDATEPRSTSARRAYDLISEGFGQGFNGPIMVVADLAGVDPDAAGLRLGELVQEMQQVDGVFIAASPELNESGDTALLPVIPETDPQANATTDLFHRLRDDVVPGVLAGSGIEASFAGITPASVDLAELVQERLGYLMGGVLLLSFLLLMLVFRSILVPLKAVVVNLLSISAAYGLVVAVFQWGWGASLIGLDRTGPIIPMTPLWLFAVLFGLSMDYEVFLVSRIHEEYIRTGDNALAVADGLAVTARVITAAATIMVIVFGAFMLDDDRVLKVFGLGLSSAVFLDAVVVRTLLVPATMELLGRANWWMPRWLDRILPRVSIEAESAVARHVLEEEVVDALGDARQEQSTAR